LNEQERQAWNCDGKGDSTLPGDSQKNEIERDQKRHRFEGGQAWACQGNASLCKKFDGMVAKDQDN
jgi:hypothetical protein